MLSFPTIEERVNIRKTLNEYSSKLQYFEVLQQLTESQQERLVQKSPVKGAAIGAIIANARSDQSRISSNPVRRTGRG